MPVTVRRLGEALGATGGEVIALVGGGGKTAALRRLAGEFAAPGRRVLVTTTTMMYLAQMEALGPVILSGGVDSLAELVRHAFERSPVVGAAKEAGADGKVRGLPPQWVDLFWQAGLAGMILVEADGSRGRSLKAPAEHEPVIPASATLVVPVVGLDVIGKPLSAGFVHRPELAARLSGAALHDPVTAGVAARIITHHRGPGKGAPPRAGLVPLVNKVDRPADRLRARELARAILAASGKIERVVLASCGKEPFYCEVVTRDDLGQLH
ncbi:MAG: putative selenium-dependent hydroxylase accessory protein YqeC [Peptococcaceae bacterium]|nr:putative selenium-dependent hydroxylase accessory protein YqeC [Peptococcaceae bacterium]